MSYDIDVFVASNDSLEVFIQKIEKIFDTTLAISMDLASKTYISAKFTDEWAFRIATHNFVNDRDIHFEDFSFTIIPHIIYNPNLTSLEHIDIRRQLAGCIFEKLKATGQYHIMFVENLEKKIDEFNPNPDSR